MKKATLRALLGATAVGGMAAANATVDITSATAAIGDASTAVLAVLALMTTFVGAKWAVTKVMSLFGRR